MKNKSTSETSAISSILDSNKGWHERVRSLLKTYRTLYKIPQITNEERISPAFFNYCLKGKYFVVIALYDSKRNFFVQRDFSKTGGWELVGGWLNEGEMFDQAIDRIVTKETGNVLVEASPLAIVENRFSVDKNKVVVHEGIAFLGRVRKDETKSQNGVFSDEPERLLNTRDKKIIDLGIKSLKQKIVKPPIEEVDAIERLGIGKLIHKYIVHPLAYYGASLVLRRAILREAIAGHAADGKTVLDVACGDDRTILVLAEKAKFAVANDIVRRSMADLINTANTRQKENIIFTNHNLLELEFKIVFDVVICKNVMHHMRNAEEIELLLNTLRRLGRKIIVMDVEDPRQHLLSRIWNWYYVYILGDQGGLFLSLEKFKHIIELMFNETRETRIYGVKTIKGPYMIAVID